MASEGPEKPYLIFQLGTNNWQRQGEFAPGSGILHEAHHNAYNAFGGGTKCYSIYPSRKQSDPVEGGDEPLDFRIFKLEHDIPICESVSPVSSYRWHTMGEAEFDAYRARLEETVYTFMNACEAKEGRPFTFAVAHHTFLNPLALRNVIARRVGEGKPRTPLFCFVHGTALKMYVHELGGQNPDEFPLRFAPLLRSEKVFDDVATGVTGCFAISKDQKLKLAEIFPTFPPERVHVSPNGFNGHIFYPHADATVAGTLAKHAGAVQWGGNPAAAGAAYSALVVFVGKFADWKRLDAVLAAAQGYEKAAASANGASCAIATAIIGGGPEKDVLKYHALAGSLGLRHTFFFGPQPQPVLAEFFSAGAVGVFPSYSEPFGMVFIECMACGTPVIGCNSGGPKDFVDAEVGILVDEPAEKFDFAALGASVQAAVTSALSEDWKGTKGPACRKKAVENYSVAAQCLDILQKGVAPLIE